jgi:orotidine-5'-phosphate decarboxylase
MTGEKPELRDRLILALDVPTAEQALRIVEQTCGLVGAYKIGSQLFTAVGPDLVRELVRRGERVFLDLKFHDIPTVVARAGIEAARLGVHMFTIHALGGGSDDASRRRSRRGFLRARGDRSAAHPRRDGFDESGSRRSGESGRASRT